MSDERVSVDKRISQAVQEVAKGLVHRGMDPTAAKELAEQHRTRLVAGETGPIHVRLKESVGFYPSSFEDPFGPLVRELFQAAPAESKLAAGPSDEDRAAAKASLRKTGMY